MKTLRARREHNMTAAQLRDILNEIGVPVGGEFTISARSDYKPGEHPTDNHAVRGKTEASADAAARVFPKTGTMRRRVLEVFVLGPKTRQEILELTGLSGNTVRPRILECIDGGWLQQCRRQPYRNGREVLELTPKAWQALK